MQWNWPHKKRCFNLILCDLSYFDSKTSIVAIFSCFVPGTLHTIPNSSINMVQWDVVVILLHIKLFLLVLSAVFVSSHFFKTRNLKHLKHWAGKLWLAGAATSIISVETNMYLSRQTRLLSRQKYACLSRQKYLVWNPTALAWVKTDPWRWADLLGTWIFNITLNMHNVCCAFNVQNYAVYDYLTHNGLKTNLLLQVWRTQILT